MTTEEVVKLVEARMNAAYEELVRAGNEQYLSAIAECEPEWTGEKYPTYASGNKKL